MPDHTLRGRRILVVEDEYLLAEDLRSELDGAGAIVVGPIGSLEGAMALIGSEAHLDGAVVDINLSGKMAFPIADALLDRAIPLIFTTGYDASALPDRLRHVPRCEKPVTIGRIAALFGKKLG